MPMTGLDDEVFGLEGRPPRCLHRNVANDTVSDGISILDWGLSALWLLLSRSPRPKIALGFCWRFLGPSNRVVASENRTCGTSNPILRSHSKFRLQSRLENGAQSPPAALGSRHEDFR